MFGFNIGGGKNKTKTSSSTDTSLDPWSRGQYDALAGSVRGLLVPAQAYGGPLAAGADAYEAATAERAAALSGYTPGQVSAGSFRDADLSAYLNPQTEGVLNAAMGDLEDARRRRRVQDAQGATAAGAWGGARHGVADGLTDAAYLRQVADTSAQLRAGAFDRAAGRWEQDRAARMQAEQANQAAGYSAAQLGLQAAGLMGQAGAQLRGARQDGLDRAYAEYLRLQKDPGERADVLLRLLGATPMFYDTKQTGTSTGKNLNFGFGNGGGG